MSLKNPWKVSSKPKTVPVYVDGERIGTAESASVNLTGFYGPITSVELTGLSDRPVPVSLLQRNYDVAVRDRKIEELESEVERLRQARQEQAEKHKQKMSNLQRNFEQQSTGKTHNTKLRKQLESSQSYNEYLKQCIQEKNAELVDVKSKYYRQSFELDVRVKEIKGLKSKLDRERGNDSYWHAKYLETEEALSGLSESRKRLYNRSINLSTDLALLRSENNKLVDDYNRLNDDINCFMEDFSEGANTINRAVEDWNATVPE